jgi:hypothetical protein
LVEDQEAPHRSAGWLLVAALLFAIAVGLTWLGSAEPPIDTRNSAYWYRTLRGIPGLTDVCGDFTLLARAIPPALAVVGAITAFLPTPRSIRSWGIGAFGIALAVALWVATTQNAIPLGELHCVS